MSVRGSVLLGLLANLGNGLLGSLRHGGGATLFGVFAHGGSDGLSGYIRVPSHPERYRTYCVRYGTDTAWFVRCRTDGFITFPQLQILIYPEPRFSFMQEITEKEVLSVIGENPMICTRMIVKKLRPDEFKDVEAYKGYLCAL